VNEQAEGVVMGGPEDPLDRLLREARYEAPPGLAARLARGALGEAAAARVFWLDVARASRRALVAAVAAAILATAVAGGVILAGAGRDRAEAKRAAVERAALDDVAHLAISPAAFEHEMGGELVAAVPRGAPRKGR
jgi:hypothetical protein